MYTDIICLEDQNEAHKISKKGPGIVNGSPKVSKLFKLCCQLSTRFSGQLDIKFDPSEKVSLPNINLQISF